MWNANTPSNRVAPGDADAYVGALGIAHARPQSGADSAPNTVTVAPG